MNKKFINGMLVASLMAGAAGSFTSCKDYDEDIDNLQNQINSVVTKVSEVQDLVKGGKIISNVTKTDNGIDITIDGTVYKITNGENGANGTAWTIGADGYWYENGQKTENKAIGSNGANGENGEYYVPQDNGFFAIYKDGEKVKDTTISWKGETTVTGNGITAVYTGTKLTLSGVEGTTGDVVIDLGVNVGSIAFVPSVMSSAVAYPTTDDPFYHVATYLDEAKYTADKSFIPQTGFDKSNIIDLVYRVNPDNAFVAENANYSFINRVVTSRAAGDKKTLLNYVSGKAEKGEISLKASINASALTSKSGEENIAALSMWNGQANTVSDYIEVSSTAVTPILVDSIATTKTTTTPKTAVTKGLYARTKAIVANGETSDFIQSFVPLTATDYATTLVYNSEVGVNLKDIPGLFVANKGFLKELGFVGQSYKFSLPKEYRSDDTQKTNQQDFVTLDGTVLKVNTANLTGALTQAIGRTPVVRIDAFLTNNKGEDKLVASAYIKIQITEMSVSAEDKDAITGDISPVKEYEYHNLTDKNTLVGQMPWMDVNNTIYGETGLTSTNFWNYYGGDDNEYVVEISTWKGGKKVVLESNKAVATDKAYTTKADGIIVTTLLNDGETQTSNISVDVNELVKSQNTYDNKNGKGAEYTVTVTIPSDDKKVLGDIVLTQVFYVKETCTAYKFNNLYYAGTVDNYADVVVTKGRVNATTNKWDLSMQISEVFEMITNKAGVKENIFEYFDDVNNAKAIAFSLEPSTQKGVAYDATNNVISLNAPLSTPTLFAGMKYVVTLDNGETCTFKFNVEFINPFIAGTAKAVSLNGNA
ncbi:MAG: hypothetical protein K2I57_08525, partial [Muribaculaceae bacterium]|nr:hypothetical protein [Muribaculaceae bacterium]